MCVFVLVYIEAWFTAPSAMKAPRRDLNLMKVLQEYKNMNSKISQATSQKLQRHLWYLSEEIISLALFDDEVPLATKRKWLRAMRIERTDLKTGKIENRCNKSLESIENSELADFTTNHSTRLFKILGIEHSCIDSDPNTLDDNNPSFKTARAHLKTQQVVNDHAEREVALIKQ